MQLSFFYTYFTLKLKFDMKHLLLRTMMTLAMVIATSVSAFAETVVYGIVPSSTYGGKTTSFDIDAVNADSKLP